MFHGGRRFNQLAIRINVQRWLLFVGIYGKLEMKWFGITSMQHTQINVVIASSRSYLEQWRTMKRGPEKFIKSFISTVS